MSTKEMANVSRVGVCSFRKSIEPQDDTFLYSLQPHVAYTDHRIFANYPGRAGLREKAVEACLVNNSTRLTDYMLGISGIRLANLASLAESLCSYLFIKQMRSF